MRGNINSFTDRLFISQAYIVLVSLSFSLNSQQIFFISFQTAQNAFDRITVLFILFIWIFDSMVRRRPFPLYIFHFQPSHIFECLANSDPVAGAVDWLVIRPFSSKLDILLLAFELNVAASCKIFLTKLQLFEERVQLYFLVRICFSEIFSNFFGLC